jgi:hypothetical protein
VPTGVRVKKLAIVVLLVVSACRRQTVGISGAPSARVAAEMLLAAGKAGDLDALGRIWGTAKGPAIATMDRESREQREVVMITCLKHDRYAVLVDAASAGGRRILNIELKYKEVTAATNFTVTQGPGGKWYVEAFDLKDLERICTAR